MAASVHMPVHRKDSRAYVRQHKLKLLPWVMVVLKPLMRSELFLALFMINSEIN
jgi:hypothetical protein